MEATKALAKWSAETPEFTSDVALLRARHAMHDIVACMVSGAGDEGSDPLGGAGQWNGRACARLR